MPNTLAHLGVQALVTRTIVRNANLKWVCIGAITPDLPWIFQRVVRLAPVHIDAYDIRLYAITQASLLLCVIASLALAALSSQFWKTLVILVLGSFLHLLLDACQIKWANGVHLLAPFDWRLLRFDFFWPESFPSYLLTAFGLLYVVVNWRRSVSMPLGISGQSIKRLVMVITLLGAYFLLPVFLLQCPEKANNHFVKTLRSTHDRTGNFIELDRTAYIHDPSGGYLLIFSGEKLSVDGLDLDHSATVSIRGIFIAEDRVRVQEYHVHLAGFRSGASYLGLILVTLMLVWANIKPTR